MTSKSILFIYSPLAKACEPPAGIARLVGSLARHGVACTVLDANLEGQLWLMRGTSMASDRWSVRALRNREQNLARIKAPDLYGSVGQYQRVVSDLNRLLQQSVPGPHVRISLANYTDDGFSPVKSTDLLRISEHPERCPFHVYFASRLTAMMEDCQPDMVGFSLNYLSQALCTFAMAGLLRRRWPSIPVVMGGGLITSWMQGALKSNPFAGLVDELVSGPGEEALLARFGIHPASRQPRGAIVPASPEYRIFRTQEYFAPGLILPYSASRGCYWNRCAFCPERAEGNRYVPSGNSRVVADVVALVSQMHPVMLHFVDNAVSPALMKTLIHTPPGTPWYGFVRFHRDMGNMDYCRSLRRSGCVMLKLGLESGDQGVLDAEQKGVELGLAAAILKNLKAAGIAAYVYLLFGTPSEAEPEARATLDFTVLHSRNIGFLNLAIFNLPLSGKGRDSLDTYPMSDGNLSLYTGFHHPRGWDRCRVRRFLDREFRRHPAVAAILRREPPFFTSNHAPFMNRA